MAESDITKHEKPEIEVHLEEKPNTDPGAAIKELAASVKEFATKIPETISKAVERALSGRNVPFMVRVGDEALKRIDQLVETGIFKSRSESVAFLINEGIKAQAALFERIEAKLQEMEKWRQELKSIIHPEDAEQ